MGLFGAEMVDTMTIKAELAGKGQSSADAEQEPDGEGVQEASC